MRRALYILADLDDHDVRWLSEKGRHRTIESEETLITAGEAVQALYIVLDGELGVRLPDGTEFDQMAVGDIAGEMSLIEKRKPTVSVVAKQNARVLEIPHDVVRERLRTDTGFAARFYRAIAVFLSDRLRGAVSRLGYGEASGDDDEDRFEAEHELDEGVLDNLHLAGDRLRRLIALLEDRAD